MDKKQVTAVLEEIADMLELKGENPFKSQAYRNAARIVDSLPQPLEDLVASEQLSSVRGIGAALAEKITTLVRTGALPYYGELKNSLPAGLMEMMKIPGLGPRKVRRIYQELEISTVGELEYACQENRLRTLEGFGARSQAKVEEGIRRWQRYQGQFLYSEALRTAEELRDALLAMQQVEQAAIAGSLRRCKETVKDIDLLAATGRPEPVMEAFVAHPRCVEVLAHGPSKSSLMLDTGLAVDLRCVSKEQFPYALAHFTGSKEHNTVLRGRARERGWRLNEYGLFAGDDLLPCRDEAAIYRRLDLDYVPPELREDRGEIEAAAQKRQPELVEEAELRGVFHVHTTASDGTGTLAEMVEAARNYGWSYLGICDHSRSAHYASGLDVPKVHEQWDEIDALNAASKGFRVFKGIESDILADGSLDYDEAVLAGFDFVIASVHSRFGLSRAEQTERIIRAIENPFTTMIGHLTGRLLLARDGYDVDQEAVIAAAAEHGVILELNANPHRLDLDWRQLKKAKEAGVLIAINPDAHSPAGLDHTRFGVGIARKGWLEAADVLNTATAEEVAERLRKRRTNRE